MTGHFFCEKYKLNFYIYRGWAVSKFLKIAKDEYGYERHPYEMGDAVCLKLTSNDIVIWTRKRNMIPEIAHEAVHAANFIFMQKGILYARDNDEHFAYYVEWIVRKIIEL